MHVFEYFEGDKTDWVYEAQYEMYEYVSSTIGRIIRNHFIDSSKARIYFRPVQIEAFRLNENNDHRIIQEAHDLIAAVFRYRYKQGQFRKELFDLNNEQLKDYFDDLYIDTDFLAKIPEDAWYLTKSWRTYAIDFVGKNYDIIRELGYVIFLYDPETQREERNTAINNISLSVIKENMDVPWLGFYHEMRTQILLSQ
jgi:hypothetical protein